MACDKKNKKKNNDLELVVKKKGWGSCVNIFREYLKSV